MRRVAGFLTGKGCRHLWVADFGYLRCWEGVVFFSFVIDVYSRKVVGRQFASHMRTDLVLDALRMALSTRERVEEVRLIHHSDRGSQYGAGDYTQTLDDHDVLASVPSTGDAYDNCMAESFVDSFKTELIADRVWRTRSQLELAVVEYVAWFNDERLHENLGDRSPRRSYAVIAVACERGVATGPRGDGSGSARSRRIAASASRPATAASGARVRNG
jgi:putative transposase